MQNTFTLTNVNASSLHFYDKSVSVIATEITRKRTFAEADGWEGSDLFQLVDGVTGINNPQVTKDGEDVYLNSLRQVRTNEEYILDFSEMVLEGAGTTGGNVEIAFLNMVIAELNAGSDDEDYSTSSGSQYDLTGDLKLVNGKPTLVVTGIAQ